MTIVIILTVMWEKKQQEQNGLPLRNSQLLTPRSKLKPNVPLPNSRRSITPTRTQERIAVSPLRAPLERAIDKCAREKSIERPSSRSRMTNRSSRQGDSSIIMRKGIYEDEESMEANLRGHSQTIAFLKKYFEFESSIPYEHFTQRIVQDYGDLWSNDNAEQMMDRFSWKIVDIFGEFIDCRQLISMTRDNGIIGLILQIFHTFAQPEEGPRSMRSQCVAFSKSPNVMSINKSFDEQVSECMNAQHLKNVLQEFMQSMYREMEREIYEKFNAEMKRMVLKHREADRIVKKINEKMTNHADYFHCEQKWQARLKQAEEVREEGLRREQSKDELLRREKQNTFELKTIKARLQEEVVKLKESNDKYQNILLNKFENMPSADNSFLSTPISHSRKMQSNGPLLDRTQEFTNQNNSFLQEQKPFQVKIDTHFIQRDSGPPLTQTTTTFMEPNFNGPPPCPSPIYPLADSNLASRCYSPIKISNNAFESARPSYQGGIKPGTKIGDHIYSPYQSKIVRPH